MAYGPSTTRTRRTRTEIGDLDEAIITAVSLEAPVTLRGVYYRCVSAGAIDKTENAYRTVGRRLVDLRRQGRVRYRDITDGTRWITAPTTYDSIEDALSETARLYRRRLWSYSQYNLQLYTEKDAISGVILPATSMWDVPLGVLRGYVSESFAWTVAQSLSSEKWNIVAQLGDHDPSGVGAWSNFCEKVQAFAPNSYIEFTRLAVTPAQVVDMALPTRPTKTSDPRARGWVGGSVEVDAIPARTLREIVNRWISAYVDSAELGIIEAAEVSEREILTNLAAGWTS